MHAPSPQHSGTAPGAIVLSLTLRDPPAWLGPLSAVSRRDLESTSQVRGFSADQQGTERVWDASRSESGSSKEKHL